MNPLKETYDWYRETVDSYGAAEALTLSGIAYVPYNTKSVNEIRESLIDAWSVIDDLAVIALIAVFEAYVLREVKSLIGSNTRVFPAQDPFYRSLMKHTVDRSTRPARFKDDIIKLFQSRVPTDVIHKVREVIEYRHWVAHGRVGRRPVRQAEPVSTFNVLTEFLKEAGLITG